MRRVIQIFLLYAQHALEYRWRSFVWFLVTLADALIFLLFWRGALLTNSSIWDLQMAVSYYLLLIIAGCLLHVHIEEEVATEDIQLGWLSRSLTKPFSYYWIMFCRELPWRLIQGFFGILILLAVVNFFKLPLADLSQIPVILIIFVLGYFLSFTYKMIVGFSAFWLTDFSGLHNLEAIVFILFAGFLIPLNLLPGGLREFALLQPIAYMIYYPVIALQGKLTVWELWQVVGIQAFWLVIVSLIYKIIWRAGLKRFSAVGQ